MGDVREYLADELEIRDIEKVLSHTLPFGNLDGKTILITGVSGLIGENLVKLLMEYGKRNSVEIKIIGLCRNRERAQNVLGNFSNSNNLKMLYQDILKPLKIEEPIDYIIHGASITSSRSFVEYPVDTIKTVLEGTQNVLEIAREKKVTGFVYLSSLEVYGIPFKQNELIQENDYGEIDPLNVRSSYSEGKRMAECLCISYGSQYKIPVTIARLSQTFGCGTEYSDPRVFADFGRCVIEKKDIVLHTEGMAVRNYCYTMDAAVAILYILLFGEKQNAYNVANKKTEVSIYEMAEKMIEVSKTNIKVRIELGDTSVYGYNPTARTVLDTSKVEKLGWSPKFDFQEMIRNLIRYMQVEYNEKSCSFDEHL